MMLTSPAAAAHVTDEQLVVAVREGSDEAFEHLVRRYRDRIAAHVRRHVWDRERVEDIVQEVFISALRGLRASDQEITFRPWIYMIARNACIDHARRLKRNEEVSVDSDELGHVFDMRAGESSPTEITVLRKQELDDIHQAFGALPDSQHRVLVLRELEGLSYKEIGRRMRLTPSAVESMLSRARTTLKGQYEEIATGARCTRMRAVTVAVSRGVGGKRDRRLLARHVRHCRGCRHDALAMGLDDFVFQAQRGGGMRGGLRRAAGIFPLPWILRRAGGGVSDAPVSALSGHGVEHGVTAIQTIVAVVAVAAVAGGGGVVAHKSGVGLPVPEAASSSGHDAAESGPAGIRSGAQGARGGTAAHATPSENRAAPAGESRSAIPTTVPGRAQPQPAAQPTPSSTIPGESVSQPSGSNLAPTQPLALDNTLDDVAKTPAAAPKKTDDPAVQLPTVTKPPPGIQKKLDDITTGAAPAVPLPTDKLPKKDKLPKADKLLDELAAP
jgi:RNA polymerase sigma factor (sigma-70 family)